jgi:hypothetical protein
VRCAYRLLGGTARRLRARMKQWRITRRQVVCYINWVAGMTQRAIANALGITQQAVHDCLQRLKRKWPDLFRFGPKPSAAVRGLADEHWAGDWL